MRTFGRIFAYLSVYGSSLWKSVWYQILPPECKSQMRDAFLALNNHHIPISPGFAQGCGIHWEFPEILCLNWILWTLSFHLNLGRHSEKGWVTQDPRWRLAAILKSGVRITQKSFGVYQCVIHVEIWNLGLGIHSTTFWNPKSVYFWVNTPLGYYHWRK